MKVSVNMASCKISGEQGRSFTNWATTFTCKPELYFEPTTTEEIIQILKEARRLSKRVKVCGYGHSPSDIACTDGYMIDMRRFNQLIDINEKNCTVKVQSGCLLKDLIDDVLEPHGMAMQNIAAISEVTIAGMICTGTHGTGANYGIISTQVLEIELITAAGKEVICSHTENTDLFRAACCSLGALGVITAVTLQCEPAFKLHQRQWPGTLDEVLDNLDEHIASSEHFKFSLMPHTESVLMSRMDRTKEPVSDVSSWFWSTFVGYHCVQFAYWLSSFFPSTVGFINRTLFYLLFSKPLERINISRKVFNFDCFFPQYVTDWAIPREHTATVLRELRAWLRENPNQAAHFWIEVRFCRSDNIMISPAYGRDTCFINILVYRPYGKFIPYANYWAAYENIVKRVGGRPHWAKAHKETAKEFSHMYPEFNKFCEIRQKMDPQGMFLNAYLERVLCMDSQQA
ncbi:L-gulonolactone oxidase-like [Amphiura filiformis]|uniref:L-gulonolactone oxidase-like n=1 Tax=Amphiura filiformis TaxID=82378 RepID=UPI003B20E489